MKYTIRDFQQQFPNDDVCLEYMFKKRFGTNFECPKCFKRGGYYRVKKRKSYACAWCANQVYPTANTIFHKSTTKLTLWFYAFFLFSQSKNGVSAKELQRHLGVTYKCAWRIAKQIRSLMGDKSGDLEGVVEADETYIGGKRTGEGSGTVGKIPVLGMVERKGHIKAEVISNSKASTIMPLVRGNVKIGSHLMTDSFSSYNKAKSLGYKHSTVNHETEFVRGEAHTNTIEGFWSQLKRSIHGTYHQVSPKYLQSYVDEFAFRWNHRSFPLHLFEILLNRI